ncbi:hypothetical protein ABUE34_08025 [Kozakia baliensis]|uniref:hypothetical protein n=1 Tax=Kozakia baliensis TaxID=153496 RepID=UPI00345B9D50
MNRRAKEKLGDPSSASAAQDIPSLGEISPDHGRIAALVNQIPGLVTALEHGKPLLFDDMYDHEIWNDTPEDHTPHPV